ncbi:DUF7519 family protein [Halococcoides cellulosivorans]|nr:hypothetical protein [Halococcoides cellulosivorans]
MRDSVSRSGGTIALVVATVAGLAVGIGAPVATIAGLGGALVLVGALSVVRSDRLAHRALGSVGLLAGGGLIWAPLVRNSITATLATVAVLVVGIVGLVERGPDLDRNGLDRAWLGAARDLGIVLVATQLVSMVGLHLGAAIGPVAGVATATITTPATGSIVLLLELAAVLIVVGPATATLETWTDRAYRPLEWLGVDPDRDSLWTTLRSNAVLVAVAVVVVIVAPELLVRLLSELPLIGTAIGWLLTAGLVHLLVGIGLTVLLAILAVEAVRRSVVAWAGARPTLTVANAAGGVLVAVLAFVVGAIPPIGSVVADTSPVLSGAFGVAGVLAGVALGVVAVQVGLVFTIALVGMLAPGRPERTELAIGSGALIVAAVVAAGSIPTPVVLGVAAAGLVVWDVGSRAVDLGALGADARTQRAELVGAAIAVAVGALGILVGTAAVALVGPTVDGVPQWRAGIAVILVLGALVAVVPAALDDPDTSA